MEGAGLLFMVWGALEKVFVDLYGKSILEGEKDLFALPKYSGDGKPVIKDE